MDDDLNDWLHKRSSKIDLNPSIKKIATQQATMVSDLCNYLAMIKTYKENIYHLFLSAQIAGIIFTTSKNIDDAISTLKIVTPMVKEHFINTDKEFNKDGNN